jgi:L-lactate dehydrogenase complex protein LldF
LLVWHATYDFFSRRQIQKQFDQADRRPRSPSQDPHGAKKLRKSARRNGGAIPGLAGGRTGASAIKWEAINHLDAYLTQFVEKLAARGTKVFWASNGQEARDYVVALAKEKGARLIIKSKSMTSEEIHLNDALRQAGYEVVESDLGEYIVQLREEAPYHLVFPAMHLTRHEISDLFQEKLHSLPTVTTR